MILSSPMRSIPGVIFSNLDCEGILSDDDVCANRKRGSSRKVRGYGDYDVRKG